MITGCSGMGMNLTKMMWLVNVYLENARGREYIQEPEKWYYLNNIGLACLKVSYQSQHQDPPQRLQF